MKNFDSWEHFSTAFTTTLHMELSSVLEEYVLDEGENCMWKQLLKVLKSPEFRALLGTGITILHKAWSDKKQREMPPLPPHPEGPDKTPRWRGKYYIRD